MREMHSPQMIIPRNFELPAAFPDAHILAYGLGWFVHDYHDHLVIEPGGQTDAMHGEVAMMPDQRRGVVVLSNSVLFGYPTAIAYRVVDAYLGRAPRDWSAEHDGFRLGWPATEGMLLGLVPNAAFVLEDRPE